VKSQIEGNLPVNVSAHFAQAINRFGRYGTLQFVVSFVGALFQGLDLSGFRDRGI